MSKAVDELAAVTPGKKAIAMEAFARALRQVCILYFIEKYKYLIKKLIITMTITIIIIILIINQLFFIFYIFIHLFLFLFLFFFIFIFFFIFCYF